MLQLYTNTNPNTNEFENIIGRPYHINGLPKHFIESTHFETWQNLLTGEEHFYIKDEIFVQDLTIRSQADFDKIIEADYVFGFNQETRKEIFRNMEKYWNEDPNSAPIKLPKEDYTFFSNQVRILFKETDELALVSCMKKGYIELFNYIYERENGNINRDKTFNAYALLHYAFVNGRVDMIKRGIEIGLKVKDIFIKSAIDSGDIEVFKLLFENELIINFNGLSDVCKYATPEMFKIFLDYYINKLGEKPSNLLLHAVKNTTNLKEIVLNNDILLSKFWGKKFAYELLDECIMHSVDQEAVVFIEHYFETDIKEFKYYYNKNHSKHHYISSNVLCNDNLELYSYLYKNGFKVDNEILNHVIKHRNNRITPGLIRNHIAEQEENERLLEIQEAVDAVAEEESRALAEEIAAENEYYEKQMEDIDRYYESKDNGPKYSDDDYY